MKHILFITFVLSICFCSCNKNKSTTRLKELDVTNIDKAFLNIIKELLPYVVSVTASIVAYFQAKKKLTQELKNKELLLQEKEGRIMDLQKTIILLEAPKKEVQLEQPIHTPEKKKKWWQF